MKKTTLYELIEFIREQSSGLDKLKDLGEYDSTHKVLYDAIQVALKDIEQGADARNFDNLVILNVLVIGAQRGFTTDEMTNFIEALKADFPEDEETCDGDYCEQDHNHSDYDGVAYSSRDTSNSWDKSWSSEGSKKPIMKRDGLLLRPATPAEAIEIERKKRAADTQAETQMLEARREQRDELNKKQDAHTKKLLETISEREKEKLQGNTPSAYQTSSDSTTETHTPIPAVTRRPNIAEARDIPKHHFEEHTTGEKVQENFEKIMRNTTKGLNTTAQTARHAAKVTAVGAASILTMILEKAINERDARIAKKENHAVRGTDIDSIEVETHWSSPDAYYDETFNSDEFKKTHETGVIFDHEIRGVQNPYGENAPELRSERLRRLSDLHQTDEDETPPRRII